MLSDDKIYIKQGPFRTQKLVPSNLHILYNVRRSIHVLIARLVRAI